MLFSQRIGITPAKEIQYRSMNESLRNRLWNLLDSIYWDLPLSCINSFLDILWDEFYKLIISNRPNYHTCIDNIKQIILNDEWYQVCNFIEFIANRFDDSELNQNNERFINGCNRIFKEECAGYRFIDKHIVEITSEEEIQSIEEAMNLPIEPIKIHLKTALKLFSDRENPDYRNSIKESISAVECLCKKIAQRDNASLGDAINIIKQKGIIDLHPALEEGYKKIYGYTSNDQGIRHSLTSEDNLDSEDAKYMLVACSAFINYLVVKCDKSGINIS